MKKHILYSDINTLARREFARAFSEKHGYGFEDHAFICEGFEQEAYFSHQICFKDNRSNPSMGVTKYNPYIEKDQLKVAIDDVLLKKMLPTAEQTMYLYYREYCFNIDHILIETFYLNGIGFWAAYLQHHKIELVIFPVWPHGGESYVLYEVCRALEIPTYIQCFSSLCENRNYVVKTIEQDLTQLTSRYEELCKEYAGRPMDEIPLGGEYGEIFSKMSDPESDKTPYYMKNWDQKKFPLPSYITTSKDCHEIVQKSKQSGTLRNVPWKTRLRSFFYQWALLDIRLSEGRILKSILRIKSLRYRRDIWLDQHYEDLSIEPDFSKKYIYFPLHYQPECTSNPQGGGVYYQQSIPIRLVAESLPNDIFIYVKENPKQLYGARIPELYDELCSIPNVKLVKPDTDTYQLIEHSIAVATLTGTAGWEGLFYGKPFLMFGYYFYQHMPGVFHVRTKKEVEAAINIILKGEYHFTLRDIKLYLKAMDETQGYHVSIGPDMPPPHELALQIQTTTKLFEQAMGLPQSGEEA